MIIVTGTKRSGTSMWMQILKAAGLPIIGEAFPRNWDHSIREANLRGFFESRLREGVYYATNPDPSTGAYLHPKATRSHVVKVFIPGLVRTDHAFLHRVIATLRPWREYVASLRRLYTMEDAFHRSRPLREGETEEKRTEIADKIAVKMATRRGNLPSAIEWWFEVYDLIRDIAIRHYPAHLSTYPRLLKDPEAELTQVFAWLGEGELRAALQIVDPSLRTQTTPELLPEEGVEPDLAVLFDEVFESIHKHGKLSSTLLTRMNQAQHKIKGQYGGGVRRDDTLENLDD